MRNITRFQNRTIHSDIDHTFCSTRLKLWATPPGYGIVANEKIHEVCRCFGISDVGVKILGSKNPMNVVKAMFEALTTAKTPKEIATMRGQKYVDVVETYYGKNDALDAMYPEVPTDNDPKRKESEK
jgi:small subunit ribosomal protein S5